MAHPHLTTSKEAMMKVQKRTPQLDAAYFTGSGFEGLNKGDNWLPEIIWNGDMYAQYPPKTIFSANGKMFVKGLAGISEVIIPGHAIVSYGSHFEVMSESDFKAMFEIMLDEKNAPKKDD